RMSAVGAVTARRSLHNSLTCLRGTHGLCQSALREAHWLHEFLNQNFSDRCRLPLCHQHRRSSKIAVVVEIEGRCFTPVAIPSKDEPPLQVCRSMIVVAASAPCGCADA